MTDEEKNEALAKFAGWEFVDSECHDMTHFIDYWRHPSQSHNKQTLPDFTSLDVLFKWCVPKLPNGTEINIIRWASGRVRFQGETDWYEGEHYGCELDPCTGKEYEGGGRTPGEALRAAIVALKGNG